MGISAKEFQEMQCRVNLKGGLNVVPILTKQTKKVGRPNLEKSQIDLYHQCPVVFVPVKPMSVNDAWQGRRFKTIQYKEYERTVRSCLPLMNLPQAPYKISYEFGFSNGASDIDNPVKLFTDILQKFYGFNDKDIHELNVKKSRAVKGVEFVKFKIESCK